MKKNVGLLFSTVAILALAGCTPNANTTPKDPTVHVNSVSLSARTATLDVNGVLSLSATINPTDATNKNLTWSVDNQNVSLSATSGASITVTALVANSTSTVTVTSEDGNKTDSCVVTIRDNAPVIEHVKAYIHDAKSLIKSVEQKVNNEFVAVTDTGVEDNVTYYNLVLNAQTRVKLQENGFFAPTGLTVNDDDINLDTDGYAIFNANPGDYDFLSLTPKYTDNTPVVGEYQFVINSTSHITLKTYSDEACTHEANGGNQGDKVYVVATSSDPQYFCRDITISKKTSDTGSIDKSSATKISENKFSFTVPYSPYDKKVTLDPVEGNSKMLEDCKAVGTYFTIWLTQATHSFDEFETNKNLVVSVDGSIVRYNTDGTERNREQAKSYTASTIYTESYSTLIYGDYYLLCSDAFRDPFQSYDLLSIKKESASDPDSDYTVEGERFALDGKNYTVIRVYHKGNHYVDMLLNYTDKVAYENVDIEVLFGNKINDNQVMYTVSSKGEKLIAVTFSNNGGYNLRTPIVDPYGVYTGENGNFVLPNDLYGLYTGEQFTVSISDNQVTLSKANRRVTLTINTTNHTYVVVSDEEVTSTIPNLKNLVFTGSFYSQWDEVTIDSLIFTFNDYASDSEISTRMSGYSVGTTKYWADFSVTYDLDTNVITMRITAQSFNWVSSSLELTAQMSEGKMTFLKDFNNVLTIKNATFNCSDFHI